MGKPSSAGGGQCCFLCSGLPATLCPDCGLASYCSEAHRQLHRPEKLCFPFKVEYTPNVGRFMVATRDIQPLGKSSILSLIHISEPTRPLYISYAVFCLKKKK